MQYLCPAKGRMGRTLLRLQTIFATLIIVQFIVVALHDWVDIPGWTHSKQVQTAQGRWRFLLITLAKCVFPGLAVAFMAHWVKT